MSDYSTGFSAVLNELDHQEKVWGKTHPQSESGSGAFDRSLDEYTLYIQRYAQRLGAENCDSAGAFDRKRHTIRKIAALAIACMYEHGVMTRSEEDQ